MDQYRSLKDHVYDHIAALIDGGKLAGDDKINEHQICEALNVSRTPVREALIQLTGDGYLDNLPRKGFHVKAMSENSAREIVEIIGPLDGRAAFLSLPHMAQEDCSQLQFLHESMQLAIDKSLFKKYDDLQHEFHDYYVQRCGNEKLMGYMRQLNRYFMKREYSHIGGGEVLRLLQLANDEHAQIVALFIERDAASLQNYIRDVHWSTDYAKPLAW